MHTLILSLLSETAHPDRPVETRGVFGGVWPLSGVPVVGESTRMEPGGAFFLQGPNIVRGEDGPARWLRFVLSETPPEAPEALHVEPITVDRDEVLLRLDTVTFPPGACAWRHVHPGPGIRHLLCGELTLRADDHETVMTAGDSWFEAANSPVRATASLDAPKTEFVRFMVLPVSYRGKPSIRILDPADAARPRLQVTGRHLDQVVRLPGE